MEWVNVKDGLPKYKKILSVCTSGNVLRDDLISEWVNVETESGLLFMAYYHYLLGWMAKGVPTGDFIYGFVPINNIARWIKI